MLHPLISALILKLSESLNFKGLICALFILHFIALPAVIHLVHLFEGKELPRFQHFRSTKTSTKFLNAWGKIISSETLLDKNMLVACMERLCL